MVRQATHFARRAMRTRPSRKNKNARCGNFPIERRRQRMMVLDMSGMLIQQRYVEMICAVMQRIQAEAGNDTCSPTELSELMLAYATLVQTANGGVSA